MRAARAAVVSALAALLGLARTGASPVRRAASSSGGVAGRVTGESSGRDLDRRAPALSQEPTDAVPLGTLWDYFVGLRKWDPEGAPSAPEEAFRTFSVDRVLEELPEGFADPDLPGVLRGMWCGPWHPSALACFLPYASRRERVQEVGIPAQGGLPGKMFFWNSPGARNTLEFFTRYAVEFQIPRWAQGVQPGSGSGFWTYMRGPYGVLPYPAAVYEGLPRGHHNLFSLRTLSGDRFWDPATTSDPALCFCSIFFEGDDVIRRNNFGKLSYYVYRVIDGQGKPTRFFANLSTWARGRQLVAVREDQELLPDMSCTGWCRFVVSLQVLLVLKFAIALPLGCCVVCCFYGIRAWKQSEAVGLRRRAGHPSTELAERSSAHLS